MWILGLHSVLVVFSCIKDLTELIFFFLVGIIGLALSESIDCLLLCFPFTGSIGITKDLEESFSLSEQEDKSLNDSEV